MPWRGNRGFRGGGRGGGRGGAFYGGGARGSRGGGSRSVGAGQYTRGSGLSRRGGCSRGGGYTYGRGGGRLPGQGYGGRNYRSHRGTSYTAKAKYVYALTLENGRKYVGSTSNLKRRMSEHEQGMGSRWTQENRPTKLHRVYKIPANDSQAESRITKNYMDAHGPQNVRGGGYTARRLPYQQFKRLRQNFGSGWLNEHSFG